MRIKLKHKINLIFHCMVKLKRKINLIKGLKNKNKKEDQIRKKPYIPNWDWMMKLKTNQSFTKRPGRKIKNQKSKE